MMRSTHPGVSLVLGLSVLCFGSPDTSSASVLALTFDPDTGTVGPEENSINQTVGWSFNVLTPITVDGLAWFDYLGDGLYTEHRLGIWDSAGNLLGGATVSDGTTATLLDGFRIVAVAPFILPEGTGYTVGGDYAVSAGVSEANDRISWDADHTVDSRLSYVGGVFGLSQGLEWPTGVSTTTTGFYGPSFTIASIPEPSATLLALLSALALVNARRR